MVLAINRYLFSLVDPRTQQIVEDMQIVKDKAKQFFVVGTRRAIGICIDVFYELALRSRSCIHILYYCEYLHQNPFRLMMNY